MDRPPIRTSPALGCSNPAISRNEVVLPQPDGPRKVKNDPRATRRSTPSTAATAPNRFATPSELDVGLVWLRAQLHLPPITLPARSGRRSPAMGDANFQHHDPHLTDVADNLSITNRILPIGA